MSVALKEHDHHKIDTALEEDLTLKKYFGNIWDAVSSCFKGFMITTSYIWGEKSVTIEYPEVREVLPKRSRGRLYNDVDDCISCKQCATACPVDCIYITAHPRPKDEEIPKTTTGTSIKLVLDQFVIDKALCCHCGLCTVVCPTECLTHSNDYEYSQYNPVDMKYDYLDPAVKAWKERIISRK